MPKDPEGLKMWRALHDQWQETQERALAGRAELTSKQLACVKDTPSVRSFDVKRDDQVLKRDNANLELNMARCVRRGPATAHGAPERVGVSG